MTEQGENTPPRQDLDAYMEGLPDVPDPFEPLKDCPAPKEHTRLDDLAGFIRNASLRAELACTKKLTAAPLFLTAAELTTLPLQLTANEAYHDIVEIVGEKDTYYYSRNSMTDNYAKIISLVEDKNLVRTVAEMVRFNCVTYPAPTPLEFFTRHPYYATVVELERVRHQLKQNKAYADIKETQTEKGVLYFYCEKTMSARYAKALANDTEYGEFGDD